MHLKGMHEFSGGRDHAMSINSNRAIPVYLWSMSVLRNVALQQLHCILAMSLLQGEGASTFSIRAYSADHQHWEAPPHFLFNIDTLRVSSDKQHIKK
jgi:hypothetical protein